MNYIRDYCKFITFDVLKTRANPINTENSYTIFKEIIEKLHAMFDDFDVFAKCDIELYNPAFAMGNGARKNKIFDEFYARFSVIIASLDYSETSKIFTLKRLITRKLRL